ncbi:hypothetical protein ISF_06764 [Cordyceps fumosorosea ARSEF 2679]|uniref:START-like domain protein n=1 Tax=Cordyceps fumosorosea (strain ARSEF 2679) TaxID=1081104 RepID=A0A167R2X9_CORFA|nr:hypothetical protein ISF_06764 [Cordyceps fumosorosea ARSEF 2679]OAA58225.1 hypothetical protein ISF_06764 [Cordyceps fumosorosea ARSEF 2679]
MDHEKILEAAFADPHNTPIVIPPADVNKIIKTSYTVDEPFTYTRTQLWDMERRKAHDPETFLGGVARPGSVQVFDVQRDGDVETFVRVSDQRRWAAPTEYSTVIEQVRLDHATQRAFFIGVDAVDAPDGRRIVRGTEQPRFHVEHSCAGPETAPLNIWRMVLLDGDEDGAVRAALQGMAESPYLRAFNEVYIREVLGRKLVRKEAEGAGGKDAE